MLKSLFITYVAFMSCATAFAATTPVSLIRVTAEMYPGEEYFLGANIDANHNISSIYYNDAFQLVEADRMVSFPFAKLQAGTLLKKKDNHDLIFLKMVKISNDQYTIDLDYLRNGLTNGRGHAYLELQWSDKDDTFLVLHRGDENGIVERTSARVVHNALVRTRYIKFTKKPLGIANIDFY